LIALIGLGNPGREYLRTRHNIGFRVIDTLSKGLNLKLKPGEGEYLIAQGKYGGTRLLLVKPTTYVNRSGLAVSQLLSLFPLELSQLLVVCDDVNLPLGRIRIRGKGSDGGHKGLASIIYHLGEEGFPRLRVGIGGGERNDLVGFVLGEFTPAEEEVMGKVIERAAEACLSFVQDGLMEAMNRYNERPALDKPTNPKER